MVDVKMSPDIHQIPMEGNIDFSTQIYTQYKDLFTDEIGEPPVTFSMTVDPSIQPVAQAAHHILVMMQKRVKAVLKCMQSIGVITLVTEPTDWFSSMVIVQEKDKQEIRMLINPKDLNTPLKRPHHPVHSIEEVAAHM